MIIMDVYVDIKSFILFLHHYTLASLVFTFVIVCVTPTALYTMLGWLGRWFTLGSPPVGPAASMFQLRYNEGLRVLAPLPMQSCYAV